jgi:sulfate permease, SulP family
MMPWNVSNIVSYFLKPVSYVRGYDRLNLRSDLIAGLTVAVILLPQAIAYSLIAELPPQVGLYAAIVAAIIAALWGSSHHLQTGPTNAISLLVLATLLPIAEPGSPAYVAAAGLMAVMVGVLQLTMGLARLGMLVNFVSESVIVGFTAGAGVLISVNQLRHWLRLDFPSAHSLVETVEGLASHWPETHLPSLWLGLGVVALIVLMRRLTPKLPGPLIAMAAAAAVVAAFGLDRQGVKVIGQLPRSLPPLATLPVLDMDLIGQLSAGALAVAAIGLVEAMAIARSISSQAGQRLDSNQEFVGQGLANIACGFLSGYTTSGSFTRSAVNFKAGARSPLASVFSSLFVLIAMFVLAPLAVYVPRTALAGVLVVIAYGMVDRHEMVRIWRGTRGDTVIMFVTLLATLLLPLQFAVLSGILMSFARYIIKTSVPRVVPVLPDDTFIHFTHRPDRLPCPQLGILTIWGDLYFGAVSHVEDAILQHLRLNPDERFLLLRMHSVNQCDISGVHMLESVMRTVRERKGDLFFMKVHAPVLKLMTSTGFYHKLGADHFLGEDSAISYLFYKILDPAICIYECDVRAFKECQNLPKRVYDEVIPLHTDIPKEAVNDISPADLWRKLHGRNDEKQPLVIDVREPREFKYGHVPDAQLIPLPKLLTGPIDLPADREVVFVCRTGRRSRRATYAWQNKGHANVRMLQGGMLAWDSAGLLEAVDE